jgi:AAA+ ATPase superfamily predicted ATPase
MPTKIGKWWSANEEIDLIVIGADEAILTECKWTSKPVGVDILANLERKACLVQPELGDRRIRFGLCSKSGFTPQLIETVKKREDVFLLSLTELLAI